MSSRLETRRLGCAAVLGAITLLEMTGPPAVQAQEPPSGLAATAISFSQIDLSWSASTSGFVSGYRVYHSDGTFRGQVGATTLGYSDTGLAASTTYEYYVTTLNAFGSESVPSGTAQATTLDGSPPSTPSGMAGIPVSTTEIDLTWSPAADAESGIAEYIIYRDAAEAGRTGRDTTGFRDSGLQPDTRYTYRVSAVNGAGLEGNRSGPTSVTTLPPVPPPPPTGLVAAAVSTSEIDLSWTAPSADDLIGYRVYRNGTPIAEPTSPSLRDAGLQPFTTYTYRVTALDSEGQESDPSQPAQATTLDATPPSQPQGLTAAATGTSTIQLSWSPAVDQESGVDRYLVYRNGDKIAETVGTSYLDTSLSPSTTYSYRVSAVNGQELEGQQSAPASATTLDATGPTKPSNLSAGAVGTDRIDLTWSASADPESGIKEYRIFRDGLQVAVSGQTSHSDTGLSPFTTYQYRVSAVNGQDLESEPSDPASATTRDGTPPTTPQDLVATPVGTGRIDLSWSASTDPESGITGYRVFRDGAEVGGTVQTVYQDDGLSAGTSYAYYIVARNGDDLESAPSQIVSAATFDGTGPTTPADLVATATGTGTIELAWSASEDPESGIASYKVFRDGAEIGSTAQTTFQDTGLDPATPYEYRVSAVNGEGLESGLSDPASATTLDGSGPTAPTDLLAEAVSQTRINLSWAASQDPESGIQGYKVYRDNTEVAVVALTEFTDTGLTQGTTYVYSVSAVNGEGIEGARSLSQSATTFPAEDLIPPAPPSGLRLVQP